MTSFENAVAKTKEYFDIACKKTGEFVDLQKLKVNAASIRNAIEKDYASIGKMYYDGQKRNKDYSDAINAVMADIDGRKKELAEIEDKIRQAQGGNFCDGCGAQNSDDSDFCRKCGKKL
ncbi:MAG: hypothetical protein IIW79_05330 [Clostridia bacterium]|nr:hypothetical protein [Clostridia bacterium]